MATNPHEYGQYLESLQPFFEEFSVAERDRLPFAYYNSQAPVNSEPEYIFPLFDRGLMYHGSYDGYDLEYVDNFAGLLVPNYVSRSNGLNAVLDAAKPLAADMASILEKGSLLVTSNHPTLATPLLTTRAVVEALKEGIPDIQKRVYITYGVLPATFRYNFGENIKVSPVGMALGISNLVLTAAISDSNMQPELQDWQSNYRNLYKANIGSLLSEPGNIVVAVLNGQRDVRLNLKNSPNARRIHHPEGDLSPFMQRGAHLANFAVYDTLLESVDSPGSPVQMYMNQRLPTVDEEVLDQSTSWQAETINPTYDGSVYFSEGIEEMKARVADRAQELGRKFLETAKKIGR